ncbi:MAG: PP2C family serine/threonine-protein phosphatase [Luteolibacter sp.]
MAIHRHIRWAGASEGGTRKEKNEDSWVAFTAGAAGSMVLGESGEAGLETQDMIFAVSDGMGGGNAGELASALIIEKLSAIIPETFKAAASGLYPDSMAYLTDVIKQVHDEINQAAAGAAEKEGMGATLALIWFAPENLYLANIGDSRIYLCRDGVTEQISKDHSSAWAAWKRGEMQEAQYRSHPRRAALYGAMGGGNPEVFPHVAALPYRAGDRFLICSDGLIDGLWERKIGIKLASAAEALTTCRELLERAMENSGADDTTLVVIDVS